jgi:hypothetical protein
VAKPDESRQNPSWAFDLDLTDDRDHLGRARTIGQLSMVAHERFRIARAAGAPDQVLLEHLNAAVTAQHQVCAGRAGRPDGR